MSDLPDHKNLHLSYLTKSFKALVVAEARIFDDFQPEFSLNFTEIIMNVHDLHIKMFIIVCRTTFIMDIVLFK